jgi:hypothetical protein
MSAEETARRESFLILLLSAVDGLNEAELRQLETRTAIRRIHLERKELKK